MAVLEVKLPHPNGKASSSKLLIQAVETQMHKLIGDTLSPIDDFEPIAQQAAIYHLKSGGQRIRAQLAVSTSLALKLSAGDAVLIAATVELVHNASLIHDDLQDRDAKRHGVDTVWAAYSDGIAICAGDLLLSAAYCALSGLSRPHLLPILIPLLHSRIADASTGQCVDLASQKSCICSFKDYEKLAALKSGSLLGLPIELALAAAGQLQAIPQARRAAESFAVGYQIFDDLNDEQRDLMRSTAQPAVNAVFVLQSINPDGNARVLARQLATEHLRVAAESSLSLPHECGAFLCQLARDLSARISLMPT